MLLGDTVSETGPLPNFCGWFRGWFSERFFFLDENDVFCFKIALTEWSPLQGPQSAGRALPGRFPT